MDVGVANLRVPQPIHIPPVNRALCRSSTGKSILIRMRYERGSKNFAEGQREPLKRSEVVDLLSTAINTLLVPENQKRLKDRLQNFKQSKALSLEVPFPPPILEQGPSGETKETSVQVFSSAPQFGEKSFPLENSTATTVVPGKVNTAANSPSPRISKTYSEALVEQSSPLPQLVQQVFSSGTMKEFEPREEGESVDEAIQRVTSASETGVSSEDTALSTIRRLKTLNVHSYVHSALRESFQRSYLRSRKIEE